MREIDRTSHIPLYKQIMDIVQREYASRPGTRVPSEVDLSERFSVSRMTVRQALNELINMGQLVRVRGQGTFAPPERVRRIVRFDVVTSLFADIHDKGFELHSQVLQKSLVPIPEVLVKQLDLPSDINVYKIVRLRGVDDRPLIYQTSYLPSKYAEVLDSADLQDQSMLDLIEHSSGAKPAKAEFSIRATYASTRVGEKFHIRAGDPILCVEKTSYTVTGEWFEFADLRCVPDAFELSFATGIK